MADLLDRQAKSQLDQLEQGEQGEGSAHSSDDRQDEHLQGRLRSHASLLSKECQFLSRIRFEVISEIDRKARRLEQKHERRRSAKERPLPIILAGFTAFFAAFVTFTLSRRDLTGGFPPA